MADAETVREWRARIFTAKEHRREISLLCRDLEEWGVPEEALSAVVEFAASLVCEGCGEAATSGPHGPDSVYLCAGCLEEDP